MTDIVAFLTTCLDEDQELAEVANSGDMYFDTTEARFAEHYQRHDPDRVLREVAAKRRLLEIAAEMRDRAADSEDYSHRSYADRIERTVAAPYADRDGYDPAWRVE